MELKIKIVAVKLIKNAKFFDNFYQIEFYHQIKKKIYTFYYDYIFLFQF